jgi:soluble lytic murein transglycosylase-like protein
MTDSSTSQDGTALPFIKVVSASVSQFWLIGASLAVLALAVIALKTDPVSVAAVSPVADTVAENALTVLPSVAAPGKDGGTQKVGYHGSLGKNDVQRLTTYLARKYRVADSAVLALVQGAGKAAKENGVDPLLVLAVMAVESSLNPFAESNMGAQGLMQVMTNMHEEKFERFGGVSQALHPLANIGVGTQILAEYVKRGGSVEDGLKMYVGATGPGDGGYGSKVLAERQRLAAAMQGRYDFGPAAAPAPTAQAISMPISMPTSVSTSVITPVSAPASAGKPDAAATSFEPASAPTPAAPAPSAETRKDQIARI